MKKISFSRKQLVIPYSLFLILFIIFPLVLIMVYAFTDSGWHFTFANIGNFFADASAIIPFLLSLLTALLTTVICLIIAYPLAYFLASKKYNASSVLILLFILPMWINFLLRTLALSEILKAVSIPKGIFATTVGMVYNFLPFMILPIYNSLQKMDKSFIEAAEDLGATPMQVFFKTTVPLSMPGIVSGVMMVFMPTISSFAISDILTNKDVNYFGTLINFLFNKGGDVHYGAALSFVMLLIIGIAMLISSRFEKADGKVGGMLW